MKKPEPVWQDLPYHFKQMVVKYLDYSSRTRLRKCSREERSVVDSCPLILNRVCLSIRQTSVVLHISDAKIQYFQPTKSKRIRIECCEKRDQPIKFSEIYDASRNELDIVIDNFFFIFNNRKSETEKLLLQYYEGIDEERMQCFNQLLMKKMSRLESSYKINAVNAYLGLIAAGKELMKLMSIFNAEKLQNIRMSAFHLNTEESTNVVNMDQWKNSKKLCIEEENCIPIEEFMHTDTFWTRIRKLDADVAWNVIQNFLRKAPPRDSFFYIRSTDPLDIPRVLENFLVLPNNVPISCSLWPPEHVLHTQVFDLPSESLILIVFILSNEITGKICHVDNIEADCLHFYTKYFFEWI